MDHPRLKQNPTLSDIQEYVHAVGVHRGFDKESVQDSFMLLAEEIGELAKALRKMHDVKVANDSAVGKVEHEAADVFWMLLCVCNGLGIDLEQAMRDKEEHNKKREWK